MQRDNNREPGFFSEALQEIRDGLNHELVLGCSYFRDKIEEMNKQKTRLGQPERPRVEEEEAVFLVGYSYSSHNSY
jgi:putative transposase